MDDETRFFETEGLSKYAGTYVLVNNPERSEKEYIKSLIQIVKTHSVDLIIPVGFIDFKLLSKYKEELEKYCVIPIEHYATFTNVVDKWKLQSICEKLKISYPMSFLIEKDTDETKIRNFMDQTKFPIIVKGRGDGSKPSYYSNIDDLLKMTLEERNQGCIIQEFINGWGVGYYAFSDNGDILSEFMHKRIFEAAPLGGASTKACSNYDPELLALGRKFIKAFSWSGVIMVECKKEAETGELYLIEINPKFWGSLELSYRAGVDFPRTLAEYYLEGKRPKQIAYRNIQFSWFTTIFLFYAQYGLSTLFEAIIQTANKDLLYTDLHLLDPLNFMHQATMIVGSIVLKFNRARALSKIHLSRNFNRNYYKDLNCIISDFDGTITQLPVNWYEVKQEAKNAGLLNSWEDINQGYYRLSNNKKGFIELSELAKKYELNAAGKLKPNIGLIRKMEELKENGVKLIMVSKQSEESLILALKNMGILNYMDEIIGRETEVLRRNQIMIGINRTFGSEYSPSKMIMVGDQLSDIKSALQLNISPWLIAKGNIKKIQALELRVNYAENINLFFDIIARAQLGLSIMNKETKKVYFTGSRFLIGQGGS